VSSTVNIGKLLTDWWYWTERTPKHQSQRELLPSSGAFHSNYARCEPLADYWIGS